MSPSRDDSCQNPLCLTPEGTLPRASLIVLSSYGSSLQEQVETRGRVSLNMIEEWKDNSDLISQMKMLRLIQARSPPCVHCQDETSTLVFLLLHQGSPFKEKWSDERLPLTVPFPP